MKSKILVCALVIALVSLCNQANALCNINGEELPPGVYFRTCGKFICHEDGSTSGVGCGLWECPTGKEIGYHPTDMTKPYPECCPHPICADD